MSSDDPNTPSERPKAFPGGMDAILEQMDARRDAFDYAPGEKLPDLDVDLVSLRTKWVNDPDSNLDEALEGDLPEGRPIRSGYHRKRHTLRKEFTGESELAFLNGLLIAHLRKSTWPDHAPALFQRLWAEHGDFLIKVLNKRWLVSAITTFGDHGVTTSQRSLGLSLSVLFGMMKLYESERLYSGLAPDQAFRLGHRIAAPLPLEMDGYSLASGGLDVNMIGRLWYEANEDEVAGPLAAHLLTELIASDHTLFQRLADLRTQRAVKAAEKPRFLKDVTVPVPSYLVQTNPALLRWGCVSTINAPLRDVARFAAHHLELGASHMYLYLDEPNAASAHFLRQDPRICVIECGSTYWENTHKQRPDAHQLRQVFNATNALNSATPAHWLIHMDVDEFLLPDRPIADILAQVPPNCATALVQPVEALAREDRAIQAYKRTHKQAGHDPVILEDVYPTFGAHLYGGFLSHTIGKSFTRTCLRDVRLNIHQPRYNGAEIENRQIMPDMLLGHLHAHDWAQFRGKLDFRRERGSYRARPHGQARMGPGELFAYLLESDGEDGLRQFFDEVCADTPQLRARLAAQGMLVEQELKLDEKVLRVFGDLPA